MSTPPAIRFQRMLSSWASSSFLPSNSNWMRKLVRSCFWSARRAGRVLENFLHHGRDFGDGFGVFGAVLGDGHDGVEEVGVEVPVVVGQAHQLHGEDGRHRAGVVEHQIHLAFFDVLVEELLGLFLHERLELLDGAGGEERGQRVSQGQVVVAVDLADAEGRLTFRARDAHLALVVDAVFGVGFVFVGEGGVVSGGLADGVVAAEVPEPVVVRVPRDGASLSELGVDRLLVEIEGVGVVVEVDYRVLRDVGACCHSKAFWWRSLCIAVVGCLFTLSLHYYAFELRRGYRGCNELITERFSTMSACASRIASGRVGFTRACLAFSSGGSSTRPTISPPSWCSFPSRSACMRPTWCGMALCSN